MGKYGRLAAVFCLCAIFLMGCGGEAKVPDVVDTPSVAVSKEGEVTVWQVGLFDRTDYVVSELRTMAVEEAGQYNSAAGKDTAVAVDKVEALEDGSGKVVVTYRFDSWESCTSFLEENFFCGTATEAGLKGVDVGMELKSVKDGGILSAEQLNQQKDSRLIVTDIKANIYCPGKVTHISEGAAVNSDGSINTSGAEGTVCILFK